MWTYQGTNYWWQEDWDGRHLYAAQDYESGMPAPPHFEDLPGWWIRTDVPLLVFFAISALFAGFVIWMALTGGA